MRSSAGLEQPKNLCKTSCAGVPAGLIAAYSVHSGT